MSTEIRPEISRRNENYISKERYYELKHFCMQYSEWKRILSSINYIGPSGTHMKIRVNKTNDINDPTSEIAIFRDKTSHCIEMIEECATETDQVIGVYILMAVTQGLSWTTMKTKYNVPCSKELYFKLYRTFFKKLSDARG